MEPRNGAACQIAAVCAEKRADEHEALIREVAGAGLFVEAAAD